MTDSRRTRGQPLAVFGIALAVWLVVRVLTWQAPFASVPGELPGMGTLAAPSGERGADTSPPVEIEGPGHSFDERWLNAPASPLMPPLKRDLPAPLPSSELPSDWSLRDGPIAAASAEPTQARYLVGHHLMLAAAFSQMEVPGALLPYLASSPAPAGLEARPSPAGAVVSDSRPDLTAKERGASRWSGDAWLLLRGDTTTALTSGRPSYGRSQAGGVLRYRLAPRSSHGPTAYVRAARAVEGARETEVAAGLSVRPVPSIPVSVAAEGRVFEGISGREVRPAAFAATELPPAALPLGLRGEAYLQAGYVGGRQATPFVDGQARVERTLMRAGDGAITAGGAVWGGAQKDAARVDIGPSAAVTFRLGDTNSRVALDYRFRVAGDAEPKSGPALTISAGF